MIGLKQKDKMKKFTVIHNFTATASIEVLADTREEAFEKARQNELDLADYDFELDSAEIGHEEDVPDLGTLIEQAEEIIKKSECFVINPWPRVTTEVWTGCNMEHRQELAENVYWNEEDDEIGFTLDGGAEAILSEFPEIEQLNICQKIIAQARANKVQP